MECDGPTYSSYRACQGRLGCIDAVREIAEKGRAQCEAVDPLRR